ncbi:MAG: tRNA (adenosine(37)-N6)-dimethylallyltransferase MiaA [Streptococcus sp.]|nr:tRNA (adenosine(37)-N6)-dimethylallyltransferase MiaA [Streptococcus sp.]
MNRPKLIVIVGPTAVGKTALGIELANLYNGEIVSGDSQQVYRNLDIGTAKASVEEQDRAKHHLIDVREANESYSVFDFVKEARTIINDIRVRGKLPIIVGGTGLYIQSLIEGYHLGGNVEQEKVLEYRETLETYSDEFLISMIKKENLSLGQFTRRRAIRQLELAKFGQNMVNQKQEENVLMIALNDDRMILYDRINNRVDQMISNGLVEEARWLFDHYPTAQSSLGIGYKELFTYFKGENSLEEAVELLKRNTRRFAKRQITWFKNRMSATFYSVSDKDYKKNIHEIVSQFIKE